MSNLPVLFDGLSTKLERTFAAHLKREKPLDGTTRTLCVKRCPFFMLTLRPLAGWTAVSYSSMFDAVIKEMTGYVYFGDTLGKLSYICSRRIMFATFAFATKLIEDSDEF